MEKDASPRRVVDAKYGSLLGDGGKGGGGGCRVGVLI